MIGTFLMWFGYGVLFLLVGVVLVFNTLVIIELRARKKRAGKRGRV